MVPNSTGDAGRGGRGASRVASSKDFLARSVVLKSISLRIKSVCQNGHNRESMNAPDNKLQVFYCSTFYYFHETTQSVPKVVSSCKQITHFEAILI